eukprot:5948334-Pyramimonas_sp.AAC.1
MPPLTLRRPALVAKPLRPEEAVLRRELRLTQLCEPPSSTLRGAYLCPCLCFSRVPPAALR